MALDQAIFSFFFGFSGHSAGADAVIVFLAQSLPIILVILTLIYLSLPRFPLREKLLAIISSIIAIILSRVVVGESIRYLLRRDRPMLALHLHSLFAEASYSFPSGHALTLFAIGGVVWAYDRTVGTIFLIVSVVICLARIAAGVHYPSDIVVGALIGLACSFVTVRFIEPLMRRRHA